MRIATWNVNSVKARLPNVLGWLKQTAPDVVLLQEIKCETPSFPALEFEAAGYKSVALGQKAYNGVAILSRHPIEDVVEHLPSFSPSPPIGGRRVGMRGASEVRECQLPPHPDPPPLEGGEGSIDTQSRYIEATIKGVRVASIYLPNGNPVDTEKFPYKLAWLKRLQKHAANLLTGEKPVVLGGDYNVIPEAVDVYDPKAWEGDALFHPQSRAAFRQLTSLGYVEAFRALHPQKKHAYTFWDYQAGSWQRDNGLRIDHFLLSPEAVDRIAACVIDRKPRGEEKASDHTPVVLEVRD
jgi:exodeoxyribonuclease-3